MLTNEVAKLLDMDKQTILYYEKLGLVTPLRDTNGYRNYSQEDMQVLLVIQYLRKLDVSLEMVKKVIAGSLTFNECLIKQQEHIVSKVQDLQKLQEQIRILQAKQLPLIPALQNITLDDSQYTLGFHKTGKRVSIGRRVYKKQMIRRLIGFTMMAILLALACVIGYITVTNRIPSIFFIIGMLLFFIGFFSFVFVFDDSMFRFVEFDEEGIIFYQKESMKKQMQYMYSILQNRDDKVVHHIKYADIEKLIIRCTNRYTKIVMTNLYTDMYVADFGFYFKNLPTMYISSAMILENDSQILGYLLKEKVHPIVDQYHVLDNFCSQTNLTQYMLNRQ